MYYERVSYWQQGFEDGYEGRKRRAVSAEWSNFVQQGYDNGFRAGQDKRERERFDAKRTITIPYNEYKELLEYKAKYEGLCK